MGKVTRYPVEVRERAVRLVLEHRDEYETKWAAITSIAEKFGCANRHRIMLVDGHRNM
jgi:transposase-like protein